MSAGREVGGLNLSLWGSVVPHSGSKVLFASENTAMSISTFFWGWGEGSEQGLDIEGEFEIRIVFLENEGAQFFWGTYVRAHVLSGRLWGAGALLWGCEGLPALARQLSGTAGKEGSPKALCAVFADRNVSEPAFSKLSLLIV